MRLGQESHDAAIMTVLEALERAGGVASMFLDATLRYGDERIECPDGVVTAAAHRKIVEQGFGNSVRLTSRGRRAVIANRWSTT